MPLITVILPTCDRPDLVGRALASVLAQAGVEFEVALVDSNHRTPPVRDNPALAALLADPRVRVIEPQPHPRNASEARNAGIAAARGEWITYLDDDDVYLAGKMQRQLALALATAAPLVLCGYEVNLPLRRRVRQVARAEFTGDECLVGADYPTPMIFHRADPAARFDPALRAGHDHVFAVEYLVRHKFLRVPCVQASLVSVFLQDGPRVNTEVYEVWRAHRVCMQRCGRAFSRPARRAYLATGLLMRARGGHGGLGHFIHCLHCVLATRGWRSWRLLVNAAVIRSGWFRRWMVT